MTDVLTADEFEAELARYLYERSEEARAVRVGEKETSEQAAIVARFSGLFSRAQHAALANAVERGENGDPERTFRLREACEGGIVAAELAERSDELENAILACRVDFGGEQLALRAAQAKLAVVESYVDREDLGRITLAASAAFNGDRLELMRAAEALEADLSRETDPVCRSAELKQIDLRGLDATLREASSLLDSSYAALGDEWLDRVLGDDREARPASAHVAYVRRMSPLAGTYTKERSVPVCVASLASLGFDLEAEKGIRPDLDDRPQKNPRACVIASDPPRVVHLITRAQGGLSDYMAFLHESGHALHYAGCDPALPYTYRRLSRDHALTEVYSFLVESLTHEPGWHAEYFGLDADAAADRAEATRSSTPFSFAATPQSLRTSSPSGAISSMPRSTQVSTSDSCPMRAGSAIRVTGMSRTWMGGSTRPTTYVPGSGPRRYGRHSGGTSATTGGAGQKPETSCASCFARGHAPRARTSRPRSASSP